MERKVEDLPWRNAKTPRQTPRIIPFGTILGVFLGVFYEAELVKRVAYRTGRSLQPSIQCSRGGR
jgi:hypothetical protein